MRNTEDCLSPPILPLFQDYEHSCLTGAMKGKPNQWILLFVMSQPSRFVCVSGYVGGWSSSDLIMEAYKVRKDIKAVTKLKLRNRLPLFITQAPESFRNYSVDPPRVRYGCIVISSTTTCKPSEYVS